MLILPAALGFSVSGERAWKAGLFFFFFMGPYCAKKQLRRVGGVYPDRRHVLVWRWVGGLHHAAVLLVAMHSAVLTQRQRAKTVIRGN